MITASRARSCRKRASSFPPSAVIFPKQVSSAPLSFSLTSWACFLCVPRAKSYPRSTVSQNTARITYTYIYKARRITYRAACSPDRSRCISKIVHQTQLLAGYNGMGIPLGSPRRENWFEDSQILTQKYSLRCYSTHVLNDDGRTRLESNKYATCSFVISEDRRESFAVRPNRNFVRRVWE